MEPLLTIDEAAQVLRIRKSTLYTWAYRRQIPSQKVGRSLRFSRTVLDAWLKTQERSVSLSYSPPVEAGT
jgi:excisionase family DNA binding protein